MLDLRKACIASKVSNGIPTYVGVLDYNLFSNIERTKEGEGFLEGLLSRKMKGLPICLRECLEKKEYILNVVFGLKRRVPK